MSTPPQQQQQKKKKRPVEEKVEEGQAQKAIQVASSCPSSEGSSGGALANAAPPVEENYGSSHEMPFAPTEAPGSLPTLNSGVAPSGAHGNLSYSSGAEWMAQHMSATFPPTISQAHSMPVFTHYMEVAESIRGLHELRQRGALTEEEFRQAKQHLLHESSSAGDRSRSRGPRSVKSVGCISSREMRRRNRSRGTSSSSSSSSSDGSRFMVKPRANVWRQMNDDIFSTDGVDGLVGSLTTHSHEAGTCDYDNDHDHESEVMPLVASSGAVEGSGSGAQISAAVKLSTGCAAIPIRDGSHVCDGAVVGAGGVAAGVAIKGHTAFGSGKGAELYSKGRHTGQSTSPSAHLYGTFHEKSTWTTTSASTGGHLKQPHTAAPKERAALKLLPDNEVKIMYFNSRGVCGERFSDVRFKERDLRTPLLLQKRARSDTRMAHQLQPPLPPPEQQQQQQEEQQQQTSTAHTKVMSDFELAALDGLRRPSSISTASTSSVIELSLNWHWVAVVGRDPSRKKYNSAMRFLTRRFDLCESFLVDREHMLLLPQVLESPEIPGQFLICLRVANPNISIADDSVAELTNRWIIVVDLMRHVVITIHRVDTEGMAGLRKHWSQLLHNTDVAFQEFLLKIFDDATRTFDAALNVHSDLLDCCERKLFVGRRPALGGIFSRRAASSGGIHSGNPTTDDIMHLRILQHFSKGSRSPFLTRLLSGKQSEKLDKSEMISFLYHLHRRTNVQHRILNAMQAALAEAFTKLRMCSKEHASQLCGYCIELSDRALEVRDDAKNLLDLHISLQSFRTNELMAVLTRLSALFTPMAFIAGVYGMNFQSMPEYYWKNGYLWFWGLCAAMTVFTQLIFFSGKNH